MVEKEKPVVALARDENISLAVKTCLDHIVLPDMTGKAVLLKPNVGREVDSNLGINTNPEVVSAVYNYLKERFDANFFIGDSPIINTDTKKAFEQSGYSELLKDDKLHFIDLDDRPPLEIEIQNGKVLKKINFTGYWEDIDFLISIPVLKMHMHCGASLGFKNIKGLIYKRDKIKTYRCNS